MGPVSVNDLEGAFPAELRCLFVYVLAFARLLNFRKEYVFLAEAFSKLYN